VVFAAAAAVRPLRSLRWHLAWRVETPTILSELRSIGSTLLLRVHQRSTSIELRATAASLFSPYAWARDVIFVKENLLKQLWGW
jgi:hypothetical protein